PPDSLESSPPDSLESSPPDSLESSPPDSLESSPPVPLSLRERGNETHPSFPLSALRRGGQGVRTRRGGQGVRTHPRGGQGVRTHPRGGQGVRTRRRGGQRVVRTRLGPSSRGSRAGSLCVRRPYASRWHLVPQAGPPLLAKALRRERAEIAKLGPRADGREDSQHPGGTHDPLEQTRPRHHGRITRERQALEHPSLPGATADHLRAQMEQQRRDVDLDRTY